MSVEIVISSSDLDELLNRDKDNIAHGLRNEWHRMKGSFSREEIARQDCSGIDVRLIAYEDGVWVVHTGDAQYETSHKGFWGSGTLDYDWEEEEIEELCLTLASELIEGVLEERAMY